MEPMKTELFQLETLSCPSCIRKIESVLRKVDGVEQVLVLFNASKVKVTFDPGKTDADSLSERIERLGYPVLSPKGKRPTGSVKPKFSLFKKAG